MNRLRGVPSQRPTDAGVTLIELLVTIMLMGIVGTLSITAAVSAQRASDTNRLVNDLNEEARLGLNRLSRELREAKSIVSVTNPSGPGYVVDQDVSITFEVDFNGNGVIEPTAADPEQLTYTWDASEKQLVLIAASGTYPVLAGNVEEFRLDLSTSRWTFDGTTAATGLGVCGTTTTATKDGTVQWWEVDGHPSLDPGNCNGVLDAELAVIDSVAIELRVLEGARQQTYRTQVDLRNVTQ